MAGSTGVAPAYVDLESTRSHCDPPPAFQIYECVLYLVFSV